jgi:hypothetical protein
MENKTVNELKSFCKMNNYAGYSKFTRKSDLINFINQKQDISQNNLTFEFSNKFEPEKPNESEDLKFAQALMESEKQYYIQNNEIEKQRIGEIYKQKKIENDRMKLINEEKQKQNLEYELALQEDIKRQEMEEYKKEIYIKYSQKICGDELNKLREARLARFS